MAMLISNATYARDEFVRGGGFLYPYRNGYEKLATLLEALPLDEWRRDEAVLGALVCHFLKRGQAARAKSYLYAVNLEFEKTYLFDVLDLILALHLGEPVSDDKLAAWRQLERELPLSEPLLQGLYYNSMMGMFVRLQRPEDARVAGQHAISCYREAEHDYLEHFIHIHLADLDVVEGRLRRAGHGLRTAMRCLEKSGSRYSSEEQVIAVIQLAIDYERGRFDHVRCNAPALRQSLITGDSWSELFFQLARIAVMATYFLEGAQAARRELETYQADYARRHSGTPATLSVLAAVIEHLEWHSDEAERILEEIDQAAIHSTLGNILYRDLQVALGHERDASPPLLHETPRVRIVNDLLAARCLRGLKRQNVIERAMRLAVEERQVAPFMEHRDVFLGVGSKIALGQSGKGNLSYARLAKQVMRQVEESYVIPVPLAAIGFNRRQYRVAAALQLGASNKQIARQLGISEATVKYHMTSVFRKASVKNRSQFIEFMYEIDNID